jgi:ABC-2 type transport system ATP-binding protein
MERVSSGPATSAAHPVAGLSRTAPSEQRPLVEFEAVSKAYGSVPALAGISFSVSRGEMVALLGPNGAGKSTLIDVAMGLQPPDAGTVRLLGRAPSAAVASGMVGAMLQEAGLPGGVTVAELIDTVRRFYPRRRPLDALLQRAGLAEVRGRRVERLSSGQRQRLRFALAVAGDPAVIVLDEPTVGMDVEARRAFWDEVRGSAADGRTVVFATHYLEEADGAADRVLLLNHGRLLADGPPSAVRARAIQRTVRFTVDAPDMAMLGALPGATQVAVHGKDVRLSTDDADGTVRALFAQGVELRDLAVTGADLEEAFVALIRSDAESGA